MNVIYYLFLAFAHEAHVMSLCLFECEVQQVLKWNHLRPSVSGFFKFMVTPTCYVEDQA